MNANFDVFRYDQMTAKSYTDFVCKVFQVHYRDIENHMGGLLNFALYNGATKPPFEGIKSHLIAVILDISPLFQLIPHDVVIDGFDAFLKTEQGKYIKMRYDEWSV